MPRCCVRGQVQVLKRKDVASHLRDRVRRPSLRRHTHNRRRRAHRRQRQAAHQGGARTAVDQIGQADDPAPHGNLVVDATKLLPRATITRLTPDGAQHLRRQASTSLQRTQGSTDGPNGPASVARDGASPIGFVNGRRYTYVFRQRPDVTRRREWRRSTAQLPHSHQEVQELTIKQLTSPRIT